VPWSGGSRATLAKKSHRLTASRDRAKENRTSQRREVRGAPFRHSLGGLGEIASLEHL
jgi:hypothetical protein